MSKLVCTNCSNQFWVEKMGVYVLEMFLNPPVPYKIWMADELKCPSCEKIIIAGFGNAPIANHYEDGFDELLETIKEKNKNSETRILFTLYS